MTANRFNQFEFHAAFVLGLLAAACNNSVAPPAPAGSSGTAVPSAGSSATAGSAATAGTAPSGGSSGSLSTAGSGANGGMSAAGTTAGSTSGTGAAGMSVGGAGGMSGTGAASGSGGSGTAGGSAGTSAGASAGASGGGSDAATTQCIADVMASGTTVTDCERCLCDTANCQPEMTALKGDTAANALIACTKAHNCSGQCCLCKTNDKGATCDSLGGNYAKGDCASEVETAAGVTPGAGAVANGAMVKTACSDTGPDTNACARATRVATCATNKCKTQCPSVTVACPAP